MLHVSYAKYHNFIHMLNTIVPSVAMISHCAILASIHGMIVNYKTFITIVFIWSWRELVQFNSESLEHKEKYLRTKYGLMTDVV